MSFPFRKTLKKFMSPLHLCPCFAFAQCQSVFHSSLFFFAASCCSRLCPPIPTNLLFPENAKSVFWLSSAQSHRMTSSVFRPLSLSLFVYSDSSGCIQIHLVFLGEDPVYFVILGTTLRATADREKNFRASHVPLVNVIVRLKTRCTTSFALSTIIMLSISPEYTFWHLIL